MLFNLQFCSDSWDRQEAGAGAGTEGGGIEGKGRGTMIGLGLRM